MDSVAVCWLREMYSKKKYGYQTVIREYGKNREQAEKLLKAVGRAILLLGDIQEKEEEYPLAVFAAEVSGNPHYFDYGTTAGQLLVRGLCILRGKSIRIMPISGGRCCCLTELYRIIFHL